MHFEKGCDPNITVEALKRAAQLIREIAGGQIASGVIDIYPNPIEGWRFAVSYQRMMRLAGFHIAETTVKEILQRLEIHIEKEEGDTWHLFVPAFKTDVKREADVVEEILRIYGYNSFTLPKAVKSNLTFTQKIETQKVENTVAGMLSGAGFNETWTNSISHSGYEEDETKKNKSKDEESGDDDDDGEEEDDDDDDDKMEDNNANQIPSQPQLQRQSNNQQDSKCLYLQQFGFMRSTCMAALKMCNQNSMLALEALLVAHET